MQRQALINKFQRNTQFLFKFASQNTKEEMENMLMEKHNQKLKTINSWLDKSTKLNKMSDSESWMETNSAISQIKQIDKEFKQIQQSTRKYKKELDRQIEKEIMIEMQDKRPEFKDDRVEKPIQAKVKVDKGKQKPVSKENTVTPEVTHKSQTLPENLQIRCLRSRDVDNQILMFGVDRTSLEHAQYIHDAIHTLRPEVIVSQLPPDLPLFIRTENNYQEAWQQFLKGNYDAKFYVSPNPSLLQHLMFNQQKIDSFIKNTIQKSNDFQLASIGILENSSDYLDEYMLDIMKMPFTYCFNNPNRNIQIVLGGYPELKYRDYVAKNTSFSFLYGLYKQKREAQSLGKLNFDPLLLASDQLIKPRVAYEVEVLKKCFLSYKNSICIVDNNSIDFLEEAWQNADLQQKTSDLSTILENRGNDERITLQQYIKNMVLLDLLTYPLINNNFARYEYIPPHSDQFDLEALGNRKQSHVMWEHWWHKIQSLKLTQKDMDQRLNSMADL